MIYKPMLAHMAPGNVPPTGADWVSEIKWDGQRCIATITKTNISLMSRRDVEGATSFPEIAKPLIEQKTPMVLDGEICCLDDQGRSVFNLLQRRKQTGQLAVFYVFDLLELDGQRMAGLTYDQRQKFLRSSVRWSNHVRHSKPVIGPGPSILAAAAERGLEGIISKRRSSRYHVGRRTHDWLKGKVLHSQIAWIVGWCKGEGNRNGMIGSLILATERSGRLRYAGKVGTGFTHGMLDEIEAKLRPFIRTTPVVSTPRMDRPVMWLSPVFRARCGYAELTEDGIMRFPVYQSLVEGGNA